MIKYDKLGISSVFILVVASAIVIPVLNAKKIVQISNKNIFIIELLLVLLLIAMMFLTILMYCTDTHVAESEISTSSDDLKIDSAADNVKLSMQCDVSESDGNPSPEFNSSTLPVSIAHDSSTKKDILKSEDKGQDSDVLNLGKTNDPLPRTQSITKEGKAQDLELDDHAFHISRTSNPLSETQDVSKPEDGKQDLKFGTDALGVSKTNSLSLETQSIARSEDRHTSSKLDGSSLKTASRANDKAISKVKGDLKEKDRSTSRNQVSKASKETKASVKKAEPITLKRTISPVVHTCDNCCKNLDTFSLTRSLYLKLPIISKGVAEFESVQEKQDLRLETYKNYIFHRAFRQEFDLMLFKFNYKNKSRKQKVDFLKLYSSNPSSGVESYGTKSELRKMVFYARIICCGNLLLDSYSKDTKLFIKTLARVKIGDLSDLIPSTRELLFNSTNICLFNKKAALTLRIRKLLKNSSNFIPQKTPKKDYSAKLCYSLCVLESLKCSFVYDIQGIRDRIDQLLLQLNTMSAAIKLGEQDIQGSYHFIDLDSICDGTTAHTNADYNAMLSELQKGESLQEQSITSVNGSLARCGN